MEVHENVQWIAYLAYCTSLRFFEQEIERFASAKDHNLSSLFVEFKAKQWTDSALL